MCVIFSQIVRGENSLSAKVILRNFGFIIQNVPGAMKRAEKYLSKTIEEGKKVGANYLVSQACFDLGCAYSAKNKRDKALIYLNNAKDIFQRMGADIHLKRVQSILDRLN